MTSKDAIPCFQYRLKIRLTFAVDPPPEWLNFSAETQPLSSAIQSYKTKPDTLSEGLQKGRSLAVPGLESSLRQTPLGAEINTATIWLLLQGEGWKGGKEKGRRRAQEPLLRAAMHTTPRHTNTEGHALLLVWHNRMFHCSRRKSMSERIHFC